MMYLIKDNDDIHSDVVTIQTVTQRFPKKKRSKRSIMRFAS